MIKFDTKKLRGRIKEVYGNESCFSKDIGWSHTTQSSKLNGVSYFNQYEIFKAAKLLGINDSSIYPYFFTFQV